MNFSASRLSISRAFSLSPLISVAHCYCFESCAAHFSLSPFLLSYSYAFSANCLFTHFVSTSFVFSSTLSGQMSRISSISGNTTFSHCIFSSMTGSAQGGAVYSTSAFSLGFELCSFNCCTTTSNGGAIYAPNCPLLIHSTCFRLCYITTVQDGLYGDAVYSSSSPLNVTLSMYTLCGPALSLAADSPVYSYASLCYFQKNNATNNIGTYSPIDCSIQSCLSGSIYAYNSATNTNGAPAAVMFFSVSNIYPNHFNVINATNSNRWGLMYIAYTSVTFSYAIFLKCTNSNLVCAEGGGSGTLVGCVSDSSTSIATYVSSADTYDIGRIYQDGCNPYMTDKFTRDGLIMQSLAKGSSLIVVLLLALTASA